MGNHWIGHHQIRFNLASPRVLEATIAEIWRQPTKIKVTQSPNVIITIIGVEMVVAPNMNDEMLYNYYLNSYSRLSKW